MRTNRRGLTVIGLVLILVAIGLIIFFLLRLRGADDPAPAADTAIATVDTTARAAAASELATRLELVVPVDTVAQPRDTIVVRVRASTATGTAVAGAALRFVAEGGGAVEPASATTSDVGDAEVRWVLGAAGTQTLRAALDGSTVPPLVVTVRLDAAAGAR